MRSGENQSYQEVGFRALMKREQNKNKECSDDDGLAKACQRKGGSRRKHKK